MPREDKWVYRELSKIERLELHGLLKGKLHQARVSVRNIYGFEYYHPPTCLKCGDEGFLSKLEGSQLICLKCGAKFELKEMR
jgi:hypothetical protein